MMTVTDTLNKAADRIEKDGWVPYAANGKGFASGRWCIGLSLEGSASKINRIAAYRMLAKVLSLSDDTKTATEMVFDWNDHSCIDADEAVNTLRKAAEVASV